MNVAVECAVARTLGAQTHTMPLCREPRLRRMVSGRAARVLVGLRYLYE